MAWNGLGTYVLNPSYSPEVNGAVIDATRYNGLTTDIATAITQCWNKNGENTPTADMSMGGFRLKSVAQPTTTGDALGWGRSAAVTSILTTAAEGMRLTNDGTFIAFYNTANAVRSGYLQISAAGAGLILSAEAAGYINFATNSLERMRIDAAGAVGINIAVPKGRFHIYPGNVSSLGALASSTINLDNFSGTGNLSQLGFGYTATGTLTNTSAYVAFVITNNAGNGAGDLVFGTRSVTTDTAPTERLRIAANGNISMIAGPSFTLGGDLNYTDGSASGNWGRASSFISGGGATNIGFRSNGAAFEFGFSGGASIFTIKSTGDTIAQGIALTRVKASTTSRQSTTVVADDPDLIVPLGVGKYQIEVFLPMSATSTGSMGFKVKMNFSGTASNDATMTTSDATLATNTVQPFSSTITAAGLSTSPTASNFVQTKGTVTVTVAGNLSIQWAQNSSTAANLNVFAGAYITAVKVG